MSYRGQTEERERKRERERSRWGGLSELFTIRDFVAFSMGEEDMEPAGFDDALIGESETILLISLRAHSKNKVEYK